MTIFYRFKVALRNRLFDAGVWKSVEFERPVVFVGSLAGDPTAGISAYIRKLLNGALHVNKSNLGEYQLIPKKQGSYLYFSKLKDQLGNEAGLTTHHKVLGLSEWYQHFPETSSMVMDHEFGQNEIRPRLRILVTNYAFPFFNNVLRPVGTLREPRAEAAKAHAVLICQTPADADIRKMDAAMSVYLNSGDSVFYVKNSLDSIRTFNSSDKIEFIQDRDNFERLILNVLSNTDPDSE